MAGRFFFSKIILFPVIDSVCLVTMEWGKKGRGGKVGEKVNFCPVPFPFHSFSFPFESVRRTLYITVDR